ncbi:MAG: type II toxin-antitoxin system VapC family toxin [Nodularia sp. (in: cyanobacteria)]|nr:type II toxin-antitoxin system VapC family toxin [Nodularia sp. (in: cyanobacteria)]
MTNNSVFIDTNILVYANLALSPFHVQATERLQALSQQGIDLCISRQTLREYLAAMTRRSDLTQGIPIASLVVDVRNFATYFRLLEDNLEVTDRLLTLIEQIPSGGKQIHDANIVATMLVYNIPQLLTHNTIDFTRFANLINIVPLQT